MSNGINKAVLIGRLGADPDVKYMPSGDCIANISVATSEKWRDKQTGDPVEHTEWHRVVLFRRVAEVAAEYLKKGSMVYIEGKIKTRKWQAEDGSDRYTTEIEARDMQMLGGRNSEAAGPGYQGGQVTVGQANAPAAGGAPDDDIPF